MKKLGAVLVLVLFIFNWLLFTLSIPEGWIFGLVLGFCGMIGSIFLARYVE